MAVMPITLSRRQVKEADRVGGIELLILWPRQILGDPPDGLAADRPASPREKAAAESLIGQACQDNGLVPVRVSFTAPVPRPLELPPAGSHVHLAVIIIGRRWVHANTQRQPRQMFAANPTERAHPHASTRPQA